MKKLSLTLFCCLLVAMTAWAQSSYDALAPFGFATCTSRTNAGTYDITGGGAYTPEAAAALGSSKRVVTLTALGNGQDDRAQISNAINNNDIIIFDGSNGHFTMSQVLKLKGKVGKTFLGINGAEIHSKFKTTAEIRAFLDADKVKSGSTTGGGGTLEYLDGTKGETISEQVEYNVRQSMINHGYEDKTSSSDCYRLAGIFEISGSGNAGAYTDCCENIIIRNIKFVGPGPIDCSGTDLISILQGANHIWIDHCEFVDGQDGNFDITKNADFVTVSWCKFSYTENAYQHMNTNLIGSADNYTGDSGKLNVTFYANNWGDKCDQRMPMARTGKIHMLNNYYTCSGAKATIDARSNSEVLIEGNYFGAGVTTVFSQSSSTAYVWDSSNYSVEGKSGSNKGSVAVPYSYDSKIPTANVPTEVGKWSGATLFKAQATAVVVSPANKTIAVGSTLQLSAQVLPAGAEQSVTWSSEKSSVAEVDADGKVKAKAIGTVKITATTANGKSDYCVLTVVAKQSGTSGDAIVWDFTQMSAQTFTEGETYTFTANDGSTTMTYKAGSSDKIEGTPSYLRENGTTNSAGSRGIFLNVQGQGTLSIYCKDTNKGVFECYNGSASGTKLADYTAYAGNEDPTYTSTINVTDANGLFVKTTTKGYIYKIIWTPTSPSTPATITKYISSAGWASFVPTENVIVPEDVNVYYAKTGSYNGNSVVAVPVAAGETIAKNTGFFVNGSEGNHVFTVSTETPMVISDNMLSCGANAKIANGSLVFGRNYINSILTTGFFPLTSYDIQLPEGIVYIDAAKLIGNQAKAISVVFDEATDIHSANEATGYELQAGIYNLSGQKVDSNYKGIVIINGRKVWKR